jgi:hypothetical protein
MVQSTCCNNIQILICLKANFQRFEGIPIKNEGVNRIFGFFHYWQIYKRLKWFVKQLQVHKIK